ncbi:hypothetical protein BB561_005851 [Smittium simulii]|uniref:Uncharacterized protein n=1 Tax=Smittium simulii TaxID=133385 RepID=A0A2T9Y815_9FUNG|nr:hypothetical protein BB561_005851 [Smittium simulii]
MSANSDDLLDIVGSELPLFTQDNNTSVLYDKPKDFSTSPNIDSQHNTDQFPFQQNKTKPLDSDSTVKPLFSRLSVPSKLNRKRKLLFEFLDNNLKHNKTLFNKKFVEDHILPINQNNSADWKAVFYLIYGHLNGPIPKALLQEAISFYSKSRHAQAFVKAVPVLLWNLLYTEKNSLVDSPLYASTSLDNKLLNFKNFEPNLTSFNSWWDCLNHDSYQSAAHLNYSAILLHSLLATDFSKKYNHSKYLFALDLIDSNPGIEKDLDFPTIIPCILNSIEKNYLSGYHCNEALELLYKLQKFLDNQNKFFNSFDDLLLLCIDKTNFLATNIVEKLSSLSSVSSNNSSNPGNGLVETIDPWDQSTMAFVVRQIQILSSLIDYWDFTLNTIINQNKYSKMLRYVISLLGAPYRAVVVSSLYLLCRILLPAIEPISQLESESITGISTMSTTCSNYPLSRLMCAKLFDEAHFSRSIKLISDLILTCSGSEKLKKSQDDLETLDKNSKAEKSESIKVLNDISLVILELTKRKTTAQLLCKYPLKSNILLFLVNKLSNEKEFLYPLSEPKLFPQNSLLESQEGWWLQSTKIRTEASLLVSNILEWNQSFTENLDNSSNCLQNLTIAKDIILTIGGIIEPFLRFDEYKEYTIESKLLAYYMQDVLFTVVPLLDVAYHIGKNSPTFFSAWNWWVFNLGNEDLNLKKEDKFLPISILSKFLLPESYKSRILELRTTLWPPNTQIDWGVLMKMYEKNEHLSAKDFIYLNSKSLNPTKGLEQIGNKDLLDQFNVEVPSFPQYNDIILCLQAMRLNSEVLFLVTKCLTSRPNIEKNTKIQYTKLQIDPIDINERILNDLLTFPYAPIKLFGAKSEFFIKSCIKKDEFIATSSKCFETKDTGKFEKSGWGVLTESLKASHLDYIGIVARIGNFYETRMDELVENNNNSTAKIKKLEEDKQTNSEKIEEMQNENENAKRMLEKKQEEILKTSGDLAEEIKKGVDKGEKIKQLDENCTRLLETVKKNSEMYEKVIEENETLKNNLNLYEKKHEMSVERASGTISELENKKIKLEEKLAEATRRVEEQELVNEKMMIILSKEEEGRKNREKRLEQIGKIALLVHDISTDETSLEHLLSNELTQEIEEMKSSGLKHSDVSERDII